MAYAGKCMFTNGKIEKLYNMFDGKCAYCGSQIEMKSFQVDHIIPRSRGGDNKIENLHPCCKECNEAKGKVSIQGFRDRIFSYRATYSHVTDKKRELLSRYGIYGFGTGKILFYFEGRY